ncbi:hypothetical protein MASR2M117_20880 [Paludibacter sp.]
MRNIRYYIIGLVVLFSFSCGEEDNTIDLIVPQPNDTTTHEYMNGIGPEAYAGVPISDVYEVTAIKGDKREKVVVFQSSCPKYEAGYMNMTTTDKNPLDLFKDRTISWVNFSMDGTVTIEVKVISAKISTGSATKVLPSRHNITPTNKEGNIIAFTLTNPGQYSLEVGTTGYKNGLIIFANPKETDVPDKSASSTRMLTSATKDTLRQVGQTINTLYFEAGVHDIGVYQVPANIKNIYLKDGAWVYGSIRMEGRPDVKIYGRGVLSSGRLNYRESHCIEAISGSDRVYLEGIVVADPRYFAVRLIGKNNTVKWIKIIGGWVYNCDGIAAYEGSTVSNCFIWANDDAIKIYRNNITWSDIVVWQLNNGGIIQMAWASSNATNVKVSRVDVLHAEWNKPGFNRGLLNCIGNHYQDRDDVSGIQKDWVIEDVVTENAIPIVFNITPDNFTPNKIQGLTLKNWNVKMTMDTAFENMIIGKLPANTTIKANEYFTGFVFDNVVFNNVKLTADNWLTITKTQVENLTNPIFK